MKKIIKLGIISLTILITLTGCGCSKDEKKENKTANESVDFNKNEGVIGDKQQDGLTFTNSSLQVSNTGSTLITEVTNTTDKDISLRIFNILVKDKEGNMLLTMQGYVGENIPAGQTRRITTSTDMNLENAYSIDYELIREQ